MVYLNVDVGGIGYGGFSGGGLVLDISYYGNNYKYVMSCQNTSGCLVNFTNLKITNDIAGGEEWYLFCLNYYTIKLDIPTAFVGWGTIDMTFEVYKDDQADPIYKVQRRPTASGVSTGSVSILTKPSIPEKYNWTEAQEKKRKQVEKNLMKNPRFM